MSTPKSKDILGAYNSPSSKLQFLTESDGLLDVLTSNAVLTGGRSPPRTPSRVREISREFDGLLEVSTEATDADTRGMIESIYGTAMAATVEAAHNPRPAVLITTAVTYAYLLINFIFQGYLLYAIRVFICVPAASEVRHIYDDFLEATHVDGKFSEELWGQWDDSEKVRLCQVPLSQPVLCVALLLIWTSYVQADIRETLNYALAWIKLPRPEELGVKRTLTLKAESGQQVVESASMIVKAVVIIAVLLPKFLIAVVLWWLGAFWLIATTSFPDLVLNAVALAFITDVDELFYRSLVSEELKTLTGKCEIRLKSSCDLSQTQRSLCIVGQMILASLTVAIGPVFFLCYHQDVLPEYRWDLGQPCHSVLNDLGNLAVRRGR